MGKLIVLEGADGSGKATQTGLLHQYLINKGYLVRKIEFPNYQSPSSSLIKMYLHGEFGNDPCTVNPYAASTFYAVDRFATFKKGWQDFYDQGGIILADRYVTSNLVHQMSKISDPEEREQFEKWLIDLEYNKFKLPQPDWVIFLDVPPAVSRRLIVERSGASAGKDIHEMDHSYLEQSYRMSLELARRHGWFQISCAEDEELQSVECIHAKICAMLKNHL